MSDYRILPVKATLETNNIHASAAVSDNINVSATFTSEIKHNTTSDYELLKNKPQINSVTLTGNKSLPDIGVNTISNLELEALLT